MCAVALLFATRIVLPFCTCVILHLRPTRGSLGEAYHSMAIICHSSRNLICRQTPTSVQVTSHEPPRPVGRIRGAAQTKTQLKSRNRVEISWLASTEQSSFDALRKNPTHCPSVISTILLGSLVCIAFSSGSLPASVGVRMSEAALPGSVNGPSPVPLRFSTMRTARYQPASASSQLFPHVASSAIGSVHATPGATDLKCNQVSSSFCFAVLVCCCKTIPRLDCHGTWPSWTGVCSLAPHASCGRIAHPSCVLGSMAGH